MRVVIEPTTRLGQEMVAKMAAHHLSVREVARRAQTSYEHIRKIIHGSAFPSKYLLSVLCDMLQMNLGEMEQVMVAERIKRKYGVVSGNHSGNGCDLRPVEEFWQHLTPPQKEQILVTMQDLVQKNGNGNGNGNGDGNSNGNGKAA